MSSVFKRVSDTNYYDGGKVQCSYRHKCEFKKSRGGRLNENNMFCARVIKAILMILNILIYAFFVLTNIAQGYNPLTVTFVYYSLWGAITALFA